MSIRIQIDEMKLPDPGTSISVRIEHNGNVCMGAKIVGEAVYIPSKADRIRAFTDEELARFIVRKSQCPDGYTSVFGPHCVEENGCEECWLEWLREDTGEKTCVKEEE